MLVWGHVLLSMAYTKHPQPNQNVFPTRQNTGKTPLTPRGVGQDKRALFSARTASAQPAPVTNGVRAQHTKPQRVRSQNRIIPPQRTTKVTVWVKPGVKSRTGADSCTTRVECLGNGCCLPRGSSATKPPCAARYAPTTHHRAGYSPADARHQ